MKSFFTILFTFLASLPLLAQQAGRTCGTMDRYEQRIKDNPELIKSIDDAMNAKPAGSSARAVITIPVVVHVVFNTNAENISEAQILSQIDVLNQDFRLANSDTSKIPAVFKSLAADAEIEFCLAQRDPQGNPSNGITRTKTGLTSFSTNDKIKLTNQGGRDAWPRDKYLNMWVGDLGSGLLGYASFPGEAAAYDGVVIHYKYFGTVGTATAPFNKGRTATHEVGHWLSLYHIWGDSNCGNDMVSDTPTQQTSNSGCPQHPKVTCNNVNGDMFMNYMDYVDDACMYMFSTGQKTRMMNTMNGFRAPLKTSLGCVAPSTVNDASIAAIINPFGSFCSTSVTPSVVLSNRGSANLTSVLIGWSVNGVAQGSMTWTGNLAQGEQEVVTLPAVSGIAGSNTFSATTELPNGATDEVSTNDAATSTFAVNLTASSVDPVPFIETFEGTFPPVGWGVSNQDHKVTWTKRTGIGAYGTSTNSAYVNLYSKTENIQGSRDMLITPLLNLAPSTTNTHVTELKFDLAYTNFNITLTDTLSVDVSTDCGATWNNVYLKGSTNLATTTATTASFVPAAGNWRTDSVDLTAYDNQDVLIRFMTRSNWGNNIYLDNVNVRVESTVGIDETRLSGISVYPNPASGVFVMAGGNQLRDASVIITDLTGRTIYNDSRSTYAAAEKLDLSAFADGMYILKITNGDGSTAVMSLMKQ